MLLEIRVKLIVNNGIIDYVGIEAGIDDNKCSVTVKNDHEM